MKKLGIYLLIAVVVGMGIYYLNQANAYPVASVNGEFISASYYQKSLELGKAYYEKELVLTQAQQEEFNREEFDIELKRATLSALIHAAIARQELEVLLTKEEATKRVEQRLAEVEEERGSALEEAVKGVFETDIETFREVVLRPEAYKEILEQEVSERGMNYQAWMQAKVLSASVEVFANGYQWKGMDIELVQES
ncbi:MAG: hypothetical protein R3B52_01105 [Candidatus Paceibacterota bacterium]